jgi:hypothetical protein
MVYITIKNIKLKIIVYKLYTLNIHILSNLWGNHSQLMHILREKMFKIGMMHTLIEKMCKIRRLILNSLS